MPSSTSSTQTAAISSEGEREEEGMAAAGGSRGMSALDRVLSTWVGKEGCTDGGKERDAVRSWGQAAER